MTVELDQQVADALPFEPKQQDAILGYALVNKDFFVQIKDRVKSSWFIDPWTAKAFDAYAKFNTKYGHEPKSDDEFFLLEDLYVLPPLERAKTKAAVVRARNETANYSIDVLRNGLTGWLQSRIYHQYVNQSATLFNSRKFTEAKGVLSTAVKELQDISFEGRAPADWLDPRALFQSITQAGTHAMTLGHPLLDKMLDPECLSGSLKWGDSTVLLAPTNVGKTTVAITAAVANLMAGKKILFVTHEGQKADIQEKIWQNLLRMTKSEIRPTMLSDNPAHMALVQGVAKTLAQNFVYIDYQKPGTTVEEVVSMISQHQQRLIAQTGKGFDMFVDDYPALLGAGGVSNLRMERRHKDAYVYRYLVDWAGENKVHGLYSIQTNREGSKKNRRTGGYENKQTLVSLEDVQEAYEVTNSATNLITINRSPEDQRDDRTIFLICKSRSSETNIAVACRSDFRRARSHDAQLPATWFRGTESLEHLDSLLVEYANREVPHNYKDYLNATVKS